ncbi:RNA polymerase sigma factor [Aerolutibacter daejeonensis]|uniref:RNA polymerase sigma factor n=1 Tax=Aerolutibacter daejeonensis TaxID=346181 RepID=UPI000A5227A1|nr:sigma-70 family RNA polymerase sigma factor [Lysobacter daejeonensis]
MDLMPDTVDRHADLPAADASAAGQAAASNADRELVEAVLANTPGAFERLVREYQGLCWHIIQRMVRHPEDTRELCQETFLRVHRYLHQYRQESALKSWIGQVAYSMAKRHLERKRIPLVEAEDDDGGSLLDRVADRFDLEAASADEQVVGHLHAAIEALPPLQRTILTLYHLDEVPIGEIASITGLAEGTIKSHLFRSRAKLRERLQDPLGVSP